MTTLESAGPSQAEKEPILTLKDVTPVRREGRNAKYITTITVGRLGELLDDDHIMVDYDYQRGMRTSYRSDGSAKHVPMVDRDRVNEIARKILSDDLFGGALTWSLRKGEVDYRYDEAARTLYIYEGQPTIPDSNHRHQAALLVCHRASSQGNASLLDEYEFPLLIEVLDLREECGLFFEYNQLGKPANPTRSRWLNQADPHSALTSVVISNSKLDEHVELVTNNISKNSAKVVTFNALVTAVKAGFPELDESNPDEIRDYLVDFVDHLSEVRPETGYLPLGQRKQARESMIGDSAVAFYGYGKLAADLHGYSEWRWKLAKLGEPYRYTDDDGDTWEGDLMSRDNPIWRGKVLLEGKAGKLQISNNRETRQFIHERLREVVGIA